MVDLQQAYASCARDARRHHENFPVGSLLVPAEMRNHLAAVYAFARAADDFADEGLLAREERYALLDGWSERLDNATRSLEPQAPARAGEPANTVEIFVALAATIRAKALPVHLFEDLLSAFRQDVSVTRYAEWDDVLEYCRRSANPVGRLVLGIGGYQDAQLEAWSDAMCTALQLTNFWQDIRIDFERGRIYVPQRTMRTHGAREDDLRLASTNAAWQQTLADVSSRTRELFVLGRPVCDALRGRLRYELRATWLGGVRILERLEAARFDALGRRPHLGPADAPWFAWRLATWAHAR